MRKYLVFLIPIFVLFFDFSSLAVTAPNGENYEYFLQTVNTKDYINANLNIYSHYPICFSSEELSGGRYTLLTGREYNGEMYLADFFCVANSHNMRIDFLNNAPTTNNLFYYGEAVNGGVLPYNWYVAFPMNAAYSDIPLFATNEEALNYIKSAGKDFEIYYNPFIVTPKINTLVDSNVGYPVVAPFVPLAVNFANVPNGYFVQVQTKYYVANDITIGYDKYSSKIVYAANWRESDELTDLKAIGDGYTGGPGNNLLPVDFNPQWSKLVGGMTSDDLTFSSETGLNTQLFNRGKTTYSNTFFNALNGGNVVEIYARYYYLEDNKAYVGDWLHWFSSAPTDFYVVQPYQGEIVQGVSSTQTTEEKDLSQDNGSSLDNNITFQGGSTTNNTNVVVNVPNAYNYPTIQSFNHDNILASFASAQANMGGLLDGFAQFASATLTWIPAQIWAVITMGFAAALVIMIIKIL